MDHDMDLLEQNELIPKKYRQRKKLLYKSIRQQMEFYFSDANLSKDRFLSQLVQENKNVDLSIFLRFNKIRRMTSNIEDLVKALRSSEILSLNEDSTRVFRTTPVQEKENAEQCTIYVEQLPPHADHDWLKSIFSEYGSVDYVSIPKYKNGKIKGFAFVEFSNPEAANKALESFGAVGCRLPAQMPPETLCSIQTFENEKDEDKDMSAMNKNQFSERKEVINTVSKEKHEISEEKNEQLDNMERLADCESNTTKKRKRNTEDVNSCSTTVPESVFPEKKPMKDNEDSESVPLKKKKKKEELTPNIVECELESVSLKKKRKEELVDDVSSSSNRKKRSVEDELESHNDKRIEVDVQEKEILASADNEEDIPGKKKKKKKFEEVSEPDQDIYSEEKLQPEGTSDRSNKTKFKQLEYDNNKKVIEEETTEINAKDANSEGEDGNDMFEQSIENMECGETVVKKKKTRRKKSKNKSKEDVSPGSFGLKILSKQEWKRLRNKYLELQRNKMKQLKQHLARIRWSNHGVHHAHVEHNEESEGDKSQKSAPRVQFTPGVIIYISLNQPINDVRKFKSDWKSVSPEVKYVDIAEGSCEAFVRCSSASVAEQLVQSKIGQNMSVLKGEEEKAYWGKILKDRENKFSNKVRVKQRGRDKLLKKAEEEFGKHMRFDE